MTSGADFAGDVSPAEALEKLKNDKAAVLVDVRTQGEWDNVGVPDLSGLDQAPIFVEWITAPAGAPNPNFMTELEAELARRGASHDSPVLLLCRSGARSAAAARSLTASGYTQAYNVVGGFEGSPGMGLPGWRDHGLPWKRS